MFYPTSLYTYAFIFIALLFVINIAVFVYSKLKMSKIKDIQSNETVLQENKPVRQKNDIFILPGKEGKKSDHLLGVVQTTIRGRIRFAFFGIMMISIACFALYMLYFTDHKMYFERNGLNNIIGTILFSGSILWGLQLIYFSTCRIKLRQKGLEMTSILGSKAYEYKDVDFYLHQTLEHKYDSNGYRSWFFKAGNYNFIWECQIIFKDNRKPINIKSSRYSWLGTKMKKLIDTLYNKNQP